MHSVDSTSNSNLRRWWLSSKAATEAKGWSKGRDVEGGQTRGENFDCPTWLHKAQELPKEAFKREVERHLTGQETEPWELIYFKMYKSQLAVIEQALETASLMLGGQKAR